MGRFSCYSTSISAAARLCIRALAVFFVLSPGAGRSGAAVIYDNGAPDLVNGHHSDFDQSSPSNTVIIGDDFTLAAPAVMRGVHWFGAYATDNTPPALDAFTVRLFDFAGAVPDTAPFATFAVGGADRADSGLNIAQFDVYRYDAAVPDVSLSAGRYFLSIVNSTAGTASDWYWSNSSQSVGDLHERDIDTAPWAPFFRPVSLSFNLTDDIVPEPSGAIVLMMAAAAHAAVRRRAR